MKGLYNDSEKMADLYGYWQTIPWKNSLTVDGKIPRVRFHFILYRTNTEILRFLMDLCQRQLYTLIYHELLRFASN